MPFTFDASTGRFRDAAGVLIPEAAVRRGLDMVITGSAQTMRALTQQMIDGQINLATWESRMLQEVKAAHLVAATLANGGWNQMDQSDFGWVGSARIKPQYQFLRSFAADIASGRQPWNGTIAARAELYAHAARQTHRAAVERAALKRGEELERNVLGASDHCPGCLSATSHGWVPIGTLTPCGSRDCLSRCRCHIEYRMVPAAKAA